MSNMVVVELLDEEVDKYLQTDSGLLVANREDKYKSLRVGKVHKVGSIRKGTTKETCIIESLKSQLIEGSKILYYAPILDVAYKTNGVDVILVRVEDIYVMINEE